MSLKIVRRKESTKLIRPIETDAHFDRGREGLMRRASWTVAFDYF